MSIPDSGESMPRAEDAVRRGQLRMADKVMSCADFELFLADAFCGRTATVGADGYPYVVPNLFVWMRAQVYLHTARHEVISARMWVTATGKQGPLLEPAKRWIKASSA